MSTWSPSRARMLQRQSPLREQERAENFPVALRILPAQLRADLRAVYDVVRVIDELGDSAPGDRTTQLVDFAGDLARCGTAARRRHPCCAGSHPRCSVAV